MLRARMTRLLGLLTLAGCSTIPGRMPAAKVPGFFYGVWHGLISVGTLIASFFTDHVTMYATPNSGPWYDLGFLIGVVAIFGALREQRGRSEERTQRAQQNG
ncbi:MAG: hypothetical protein HYY96_07000 [Candidatus Tectomicrobia bacterium]|nr:hypothetical protein [Candidatus Tectomicrobia bacterium]